MLNADMFDVASIGIHPRNSAPANSAAVREAQLNMPPGTTQRWFFTAGRYSFDDTFHIIRPIWLEGVGGSWPQSRTVFQFPAGKHGLYFHYPPDGESGNNAQGASASNISVEATGKTAVAHGVVVRATCTLSHLLITGFRGDGINAVATLPQGGPPPAVRVKGLSRVGRILFITTAGAHDLNMGGPLWLESASPEIDFPRGACHVTRVIDEDSFECRHELELTGSASASASYRIVAGPAQASSSLTRLESVKAAANGNSLDVATLSRDGRMLSVSTVGPHRLQVDNHYWLESSSPTADFPRGVCDVTRVIDDVSFEGRHEVDTLSGKATASGSYRVVVGHGMFTNGSDASAGLSIACHFENNAGWGVCEHSSGGNAYYGCNATANQVGPYRTVKVNAAGNVFLNCYSEGDQNPSDIGVPAIVIGGQHGADIVGTGLVIDRETATQLAFLNGSEGYVRLGSRDKGPTSTRYLAFFNVQDGPANELTVDFDQARRYKRMLGFGQCGNHQHPAFLISGPNSVMSDWEMALDESNLVINRRFWLDMTRHETVDRIPDNVTHDHHDTWNLGDRAWNRDVLPGGSEGWICTTAGTLGVYREGRTATANGTKTVTLDGPSTVLKVGMYLIINDTLCRVAEVSGATLTMVAVVPAGGPGLTITYRPPDFREFGYVQKKKRQPLDPLHPLGPLEPLSFPPEEHGHPI